MRNIKAYSVEILWEFHGETVLVDAAATAEIELIKKLCTKEYPEDRTWAYFKTAVIDLKNQPSTIEILGFLGTINYGS